MKISPLNSAYVRLDFPYNERTATLVKSLPGRQYVPKLQAWVLPCDGLLADNISRLQAAGFKLADGLLSQSSSPAPFDTALPLYPYQKEVAAFMAKGSCLNACFVGAGKTLTTLAVCEHLQAKKVLIVVPKSVLLQWATAEIPKWLPEAKAVAVTGSARSRTAIYEGLDSYQYVVIGYETLRSDISRLVGVNWDVVACDEAHRLANPRTQTYKALMLVKSPYRYAMTATPVMNRPDDMFGIINWIRPGSLGNYFGFLKRYCVYGGFNNKVVVAYRKMDELAQRVKPYIIRKELEEVGLQLPDKTEVDIPVALSDKEQDLYNKIRANLLFEIEKEQISKIASPVALQNTLTKIGKLFELVDSLELIGESTESSKLEALKEHLEGTLINGQKAIIITRFSRMAEILTRELESSGYHPLLITGQTQDRAGTLRRFEEGNARILIGTEAIGQGLNLQVANILYNYDLPWNPARLEQRIGRIHRNGQDKPVFVYNLVTTSSVEKWLKNKLKSKAQLSETLLPKTLEEVKEMLV